MKLVLIIPFIIRVYGTYDELYDKHRCAVEYKIGNKTVEMGYVSAISNEHSYILDIDNLYLDKTGFNEFNYVTKGCDGVVEEDSYFVIDKVGYVTRLMEQSGLSKMDVIDTNSEEFKSMMKRMDETGAHDLDRFMDRLKNKTNIQDNKVSNANLVDCILKQYSFNVHLRISDLKLENDEYLVFYVVVTEYNDMLKQKSDLFLIWNDESEIRKYINLDKKSFKKLMKKEVKEEKKATPPKREKSSGWKVALIFILLLVALMLVLVAIVIIWYKKRRREISLLDIELLKDNSNEIKLLENK